MILGLRVLRSITTRLLRPRNGTIAASLFAVRREGHAGVLRPLEEGLDRDVRGGLGRLGDGSGRKPEKQGGQQAKG
jgi:hypothetical protein